MFKNPRRKSLLHHGAIYPVPAEKPVNYSSVMDYLVGLSNEDYEKVGKVSRIYRDAEDQAATALGKDRQVTTAIFEDNIAEDILAGLPGVELEFEATPDDLIPVNPAKEFKSKRVPQPKKARKK